MINISARPPTNLSLFGFKSSRKGEGAIACPVALIIIIIIVIIIIIIIIIGSFKELVGVRAGKILLDMQKAVISSTLNIARSFKVLTAQDL